MWESFVAKMNKEVSERLGLDVTFEIAPHSKEMTPEKLKSVHSACVYAYSNDLPLEQFGLLTAFNSIRRLNLSATIFATADATKLVAYFELVAEYIGGGDDVISPLMVTDYLPENYRTSFFTVTSDIEV